MSKFRRGTEGKGTPEVSTASLPDIVFITLAFFMVTSAMRETTLKVSIVKPSASELLKVDKRAPIHYLYSGKPANKKSDKFLVQYDDQILKSTLDIRNAITNTRNNWEYSQDEILTKEVVSIEQDKDADMAMTDKIENNLREVDALRVSYAAKNDRK